MVKKWSLNFFMVLLILFSLIYLITTYFNNKISYMEGLKNKKFNMVEKDLKKLMNGII